MGRTVWWTFRHWFAVASTVALACAVSYAQSTQLEQVSLGANGQVELSVSGEGFDPLLSSKVLPNKLYQITCRGEEVGLSTKTKQSLTAFKRTLQQRYPDIVSMELLPDSRGFLLQLTSKRKLQPQVRQNTGTQISIELVGAVSQIASTKTVVQLPDIEKQSFSEARLEPNMDTVELSIDERLARRQTQANAQRALIKAQESQWQAHPASEPQQLAFRLFPHSKKSESSVQSHDSKATEKPSGSPAILPENLPATEQSPTPAPLSQDEPETPLHLSTPPSAYLYTDERPQGTESLRQITSQPIADLSLYALLSSPQTNPQLKNAVRQLVQGQASAALISLQQYTQHTPKESAGLYALAMAQNANHAEKQGQATLKALLSETPYLPAYMTLIDWLLSDNQISQAETYVTQAELLTDKHPHLLFLKGKLFESKQNHQQARDYYQQAIAAAPYFTEAHYRLAQVALKLGNWAEAEWELLQVLQNTPDDGRSLKLLAFVAQKNRDKEQAKHLYEKASQPDVLLNYARLLSEQGQKEKALRLLGAVETLGEDNPELLYNVGMTYAELKASAEAKASLRQFIVKKPSDSRVAQALETIRKLPR